MLHEIRNVKQERGPGRRRWFESDGLDLVVWFNERDDMVGFQLCYDVGYGEHALTWRTNTGFKHHAIDTGEDMPLKNRTPVLVANGSVPWPMLSRVFEERCASLEPWLRHMVHDRIAEFADAKSV